MPTRTRIDLAPLSCVDAILKTIEELFDLFQAVQRFYKVNGTILVQANRRPPHPPLSLGFRSKHGRRFRQNNVSRFLFSYERACISNVRDHRRLLTAEAKEGLLLISGLARLTSHDWRNVVSQTLPSRDRSAEGERQSVRVALVAAAHAAGTAGTASTASAIAATVCGLCRVMLRSLAGHAPGSTG